MTSDVSNEPVLFVRPQQRFLRVMGSSHTLLHINCTAITLNYSSRLLSSGWMLATPIANQQRVAKHHQQQIVMTKRLGWVWNKWTLVSMTRHDLTVG